MAFTGCGGNQDFYCEKIRNRTCGSILLVSRTAVMINRDSRGPFAKDVFINQGTKVRGSKTIRYRRSLNHKLCRLGIGRDSIMTRSAPYEKSKFLGSGGGMVARLKLKEIDGRAPQGVEPAA
ncbi:hypothetical protein N7530_012923 [Penicillium desertorum]|uniref:Uncharacterized protein n=1 Tax=Penicillium desertorum TaxID=1303715 RepID=A0A9W9WD55_9EURO|nr:hypothetical protein N7530_012884 [Penicillium desertorum]KAJ5453329.1 hypothetical protein N7530_012923 [Penicillium desertorum]